MKKRILKLFIVVFISIVVILASVIPVYALANPDAISFGTNPSGAQFEAFYNVSETGDMLFIAESYIHYASYTGIPDSNTAFLFSLLSPDGLTVYISQPIWAYENVPTSIYLTAATVASMGLTQGTAYKLRIAGSPLLFPTLIEGTNEVTVSLTSSLWFDQTLNSAGILSPIRAFSLKIMQDIQAHDAVTTYLTSINGRQYVTDVGSNILLGGVFGLDVFCSQIFQFSVTNIVPTTPSSAGTYANSLNSLGQLGSSTDLGFKEFGIWLGLGTSGVMAGALIYLLASLGAVVWMATKIQSPLVLPIGTLGLMSVGAFLGVIPLAILFMVIAFIVVLTGIYFFTRGFWT